MAVKQRLNFSTYPQDYFTGAQARIYFGSVWVDDIATIQYQSSHSKTPLYGYGDHQFRMVAKGQFLVRGSFTVAFKETGYMYSVMKLVQSELNGTASFTDKSFNTYIDYISQGMTVEQALDYTASKHNTTGVVGTQFKQQADFEDIAEVMEDAIWGKPGTPVNFQGRIPRSDELDYNQYTSNNEIGNNGDIDRDSFDILITFGNYKSGNDSAETTMISLNGVHITGESMIVSPAAEPIGVTYDFFAIGLNEKISSSWDLPINNDIKQKQAKAANNTKPILGNANKPNSSDLTNPIINNPAETPKTQAVTMTNPAPSLPSYLLNKPENMLPVSVPVYDAAFIPTLESIFPAANITGQAPLSSQRTTEVVVPATESTPVQVVIKPPPEIPSQSFNITVPGDLNEAFNKAKMAAPDQGAKINGDSTGGNIVVKKLVFTINMTYKTYGNTVHVESSDKLFSAKYDIIFCKTS